MKIQETTKKLSTKTYYAIINGLWHKGFAESSGCSWYSNSKREMTEAEIKKHKEYAKEYQDRMFSLEALADLGVDELGKFRNIGTKRLEEIRLIMAECGITLKEGKKSETAYLIPIKRP